jgi:hypothetical protein
MKRASHLLDKERVMRHRGSILLVLALGLLPTLAFAAGAVDVTGVWEMTIQIPQGEQTIEATFTQEGEKLKVSMEGPQGYPLEGEGTVKENVVEWAFFISSPMGEFSLFFKGKVDGGMMSGEVQMGDFGAAVWSAKKK